MAEMQVTTKEHLAHRRLITYMEIRNVAGTITRRNLAGRTGLTVPEATAAAEWLTKHDLVKRTIFVIHGRQLVGYERTMS